MDKRYQVFVSSTYRDLIERRQRVIKALMELNAIPAGMETFPASEHNAWTVIQRSIDHSDYYIVIIGGRYGSLDADGMGYTEKEYDYAVQQGKPVMAFLYRNPDNLPRADTESDAALWQKLKDFRAKAEKRLCRYWETDEELNTAVLASYVQILNSHPGTGWVRGDQARTIADVQKLADLQERLNALEAENRKLREQASDRTDEFLQGQDVVPVALQSSDEANKPFAVETTWDELFRAAGRAVLKDPLENHVLGQLARAVKERGEALGLAELSSEAQWNMVYLPDAEFERIKYQFLALKLISIGQIDHQVPDQFDWTSKTQTYRNERKAAWRLTARGEEYLGQLSAARREPVLSPKLSG